MATGRKPMAIDRDREEVLWAQWPQSRGDLCVLYQPVVFSIVNAFAKRLPKLATTCHEELVSMGQIGLLNALDAYDQGKNVRFTSFCGLRIRGAILDELRRLDHVPRRERERCRKTGEALPMMLTQSEVPDHGVEDDLVEEVFRRNPDMFMRYLEHSLRRVARLVVIEGKSKEEAAREMGKSPKAIEEVYGRLMGRLLEVFRSSGVTVWGESRN